eukprot:761932-Hanusia_phi.AAC.1
MSRGTGVSEIVPVREYTVQLRYTNCVQCLLHASYRCVEYQYRFPVGRKLFVPGKTVFTEARASLKFWCEGELRRTYKSVLK